MHLLHAPGVLDGREADTDDANGEDDASHPDAGAELGHDQVRGAVEDNVGDVEERKRGRHILGREVQHGHQVVAGGGVHGLRQPDVGADRGAEKIEHPESYMYHNVR